MSLNIHHIRLLIGLKSVKLQQLFVTFGTLNTSNQNSASVERCATVFSTFVSETGSLFCLQHWP